MVKSQLTHSSRLQSSIILSVAPSRPEHLKVKYQGPSSFPRKQERTNSRAPRPETAYKGHAQPNYSINLGNSLAHNYPIKGSTHFVSQHLTPQGSCLRPQNPYNDESVHSPSQFLAHQGNHSWLQNPYDNRSIILPSQYSAPKEKHSLPQNPYNNENSLL